MSLSAFILQDTSLRDAPHHEAGRFTTPGRRWQWPLRDAYSAASAGPVPGPAMGRRKPRRRYAARTVERNLSTSTLRWLLSLDNDCAEESTCVDAAPVWLAPRLTSVMLLA